MGKNLPMSGFVLTGTSTAVDALLAHHRSVLIHGWYSSVLTQQSVVAEALNIETLSTCNAAHLSRVALDWFPRRTVNVQTTSSGVSHPHCQKRGVVSESQEGQSQAGL